MGEDYFSFVKSRINIYDSDGKSLIDDKYDEDLQKVTKAGFYNKGDYVVPLKNGNYLYMENQRTIRDSDQDLTYDICAKLNIEHLYRENVAYMTVSVGERTNDGKPECTYSFAVTHGSGGGIYTGAAVNRNERFGNIIDGLDCFVAGHVHKAFVSKPAKIVIDARNSVVKMRHYVVISCTSWLNYGGYAARAMLLPAETCDPQRLHLNADHNNKRIITTW